MRPLRDSAELFEPSTDTLKRQIHNLEVENKQLHEDKRKLKSLLEEKIKQVHLLEEKQVDKGELTKEEILKEKHEMELKFLELIVK